MDPKISFITAIKDRPDELKEMIKSLIAQDIPDWEAIIVDDHSREPIKEVVESFSDNRLRYFRQVEDKKGISEARNYAIKYAKSNIMLIADGDDINLPCRARVTFNIMTRKKCDVFYGNMRLFKVGKRRYDRKFQPFNKDLLKMINYISNPASAFLKDRFIKIGGYDPEFIVTEDYDLWLRFLNSNERFCYTRKVLVDYRQHKESISQKKYHLLLFHRYVQRARIKNKIPPFDILEVKRFAKPEIAKVALSKMNLCFWQDDRFEKNKNKKVK